MGKASASIYFDPRRMKPDHFSVKISIYFNEKQKLVPTKIILPLKDVEFLKRNKAGLSGRVKDDQQRNLWNQIFGVDYMDELTGQRKESYLHKAQRIISELDAKFTFEGFLQKFTSAQVSSFDVDTDMLDALESQMRIMAAAENFGREGIYKSARQSLIRFVVEKRITSKTNPRVPFSIVTPDFLKNYEKYMLEKGKTHRLSSEVKPLSMTTIAFYMNCFGVVLRKAVEDKVISQDELPLGKKKYNAPKGRKSKSALPGQVIRMIMDYSHPRTSRIFARDMWIFSYLCSGINISDICRLKWMNVNESQDQLTFIRKKTRDKGAEKGRQITIKLIPQAKDIFQKYAVTSNDKEDYVFGFLSQQMDEKSRLYAITITTNRINAALKVIAAELGLKFKLTTYVARHSFATTLLRSEVPIAFISQSLGHTNIATTQEYLGSFEDEQTQIYMNALIPKLEENND